MADDNARVSIQRVTYWTLLLCIIGGIRCSEMKLLERPVPQEQVAIDIVKQEPIPRQIRGLGRLVAEETRWVPAVTDGRVEKRLIEEGERVDAETVLIELSNPRVKQETTDAEWEWESAQSSYTDLKAKLESEQLIRKDELNKIQSAYRQAMIRYNANVALAKDGLIPNMTVQLDRAAVEELAASLRIKTEMGAICEQSSAAQLLMQQTRIDRLHAVYTLRKHQLNQLRVRAGVGGILQVFSVDVGQQVSPGANLAKVANPNRIKAELLINEIRAKDIQIGQTASIDTHNGVVHGRVTRMSPVVKDGMITVDVSLDAALPRGSMPDLTVEGTILLERLNDSATRH